MKKFLAFLIVLMISLTLYAGFSYKLDLLSFDPVYRENIADKDSPGLQFNYIYNFSGFPDHIYQDSPNEDVPLDPQRFDFTYGIKSAPWMGQIKVGETLSLFRNTFSFDHVLSPVTIDFSAQGGVNFLFEGAMADSFGYDGAFFYGTTISVADRFAMRFGLHHYCNHYGDSIIKRIKSAPNWDRFWPTYKYVRMDALVLGISIEPVDFLRIYGEYNWIPRNIDSWRPTMFRPSTLEGFDVLNENYPESYKARIISCGIELSYPIFRKLGKTALAYDLHMYEEGKIRYRDEEGNYYLDADKIGYDESKPWICEHGLVLSQEVSSTVSFEIAWHHGRSASNIFWFIDDSSWVYVGARFNPDATVTLYDSAK